MSPIKDQLLKLTVRKQLLNHSIKIEINCSPVGQVVNFHTSFWSLPENARRLTYGKDALKLERALMDYQGGLKFLLPLLALSKKIQPTGLPPEEVQLAKKLRENFQSLSVDQQMHPERFTTDPWIAKLVQRANGLEDIDFRRKLELIYQVVTLREVNIYQLINELKIHDDELFILPLIAGLDRTNTTFRAFASSWLQDQLHPEMTEVLIDRLSASDEWVRTTIIHLLEKLKAETAIPAMTDLLLRDTSTKVKSKAAFFLGNIPSETAVEGLLAATRDGDWMVRQNALEALGKVGARMSVKPLIKLLNDIDFKEKRDVISALGYHPFPEISELLMPFLNDMELRFVTISALGKIGNPAAIPSIEAVRKKTKSAAKIRMITRVLEKLKTPSHLSSEPNPKSNQMPDE